MSLFNSPIFGDNPVLTDDNPEIQKVMQYMYDKYETFIVVYTYRKQPYYRLRSKSRRLFQRLYYDGLINNGFLTVPGHGTITQDKMDAYEALVWMFNYYKGLGL